MRCPLPVVEEIEVAVAAGAGDDAVRVTGSLSGTFVDGGDDADRLPGGPNDERLFGGPGADVLRGGAGDDELTGDDPVAGAEPPARR